MFVKWAGFNGSLYSPSKRGTMVDGLATRGSSKPRATTPFPIASVCMSASPQSPPILLSIFLFGYIITIGSPRLFWERLSLTRGLTDPRSTTCFGLGNTSKIRSECSDRRWMTGCRGVYSQITRWASFSRPCVSRQTRSTEGYGSQPYGTQWYSESTGLLYHPHRGSGLAPLGPPDPHPRLSSFRLRRPHHLQRGLGWETPLSMLAWGETCRAKSSIQPLMATPGR
mmetsp:Transcript_37694/g.61091  ORF Transcript_37694/g.61091 Transcript_37694/m.61091 type:complete len:226 (-) Transcript_37694:1250-1927(-)